MNARPEVTVLVTGAGAPGIRGTLFSLKSNADEVPVRTVGVDLSAGAIGRHLVDVFEVVPAPESAGYVDAMLELCRRHHVHVLLPQTSRETLCLGEAKAAFTAQGIGVLAPSPLAVHVASSKLLTLHAFEDAGLPVPAFRGAATPDEVEAAAIGLGYPDCRVLVKPTLSNGSRGVRIIDASVYELSRLLSEKPENVPMSLDDLLTVLRRGAMPEFVVSEYLPGHEYSVDAFRGVRLEIAVPRKRTAIRSGISFVTDLEDDPELRDQTIRGARAIGVDGVFGFQFKLDVLGRPRVLECNPRVQGTMVASTIAGANLIWFAVREALGDPVSDAPAIDWSTRFSRSWGGVGERADGVVTIR